MSILVAVAIGLALTLCILFLFFQHPQFGKRPRGSYRQSLQRSPHFKNGQFHNLMPTPAFAEGTTYWKIFQKMLFGASSRKRPTDPIPSVKTDLNEIGPSENALVWFGHSSYFLQVEGMKFLVDPVFSGSASPLPFGTRAFKGSDIYSAEDMPLIDVLVITHDHWDHLDYKTIKTLRSKIDRVITPLGTKPHFLKWGYQSQQIQELDWNQSTSLKEGFTMHAVPTRHFSGRTFLRNTSLWTAYVLSTPGWQLFLGGDSGYGSHFKTIGEKFGPFDLVILENGQYNPDWRYIHLLPEQFFTAARDLGAKNILPVHHSKFNLSLHAWDAPLKAISELRSQQDPPLYTPRIGEKVNLNAPGPFDAWWLGLS